MSGLVGGCLLGFLLGLRHAFEPDHLAAVSALLGREAPRRSAVLGLWWGAGHSTSLFFVAGVLSLFCWQMPSGLAQLLEVGVGVVLVVLGVRNLRLAARAEQHQHDDAAHTHPHGAAHIHLGRRVLARRPLLIGLMHGLAGSGALTALVLLRMPSFAGRLAYVVLFGLGSTLGMALVTALLGWCLRHLVRGETTRRRFIAASGVLSIAAAAALLYPIVRGL